MYGKWLRYFMLPVMGIGENTGGGGQGGGAGNAGDTGGQDGSGGSGNAGGGPGRLQFGNQGQQTKEETNELDPFAQPKGTGDNSNTQAAGNEQNANAQGGNQGNQGNQSQTWAQFVDGLNLAGDVDTNAIAEGFRDGNAEPFQSAMKSVAANTFRQAMLATNSLVEQRVAAAVETAVAKATGTVNGDMALKAVTEALPFTGTPAMKPVAQAALAGFLRQGMSQADAIQATQQYFENQAGAMAKHFGYHKQSGNPPGRSNFRNGQNASTTGNQNGDEAPMDDWMQILGGPPG